MTTTVITTSPAAAPAALAIFEEAIRRADAGRPATALRRDVFGPLPGHGRWRHLLLADGKHRHRRRTRNTPAPMPRAALPRWPAARRIGSPRNPQLVRQRPAPARGGRPERAVPLGTIQSGVFQENTASLALHRSCGFRTVGVRERVGRHTARGNRWRDVVFIERRSPAIT
ncbi:GNAT family N-acetyltransferase [Actinoplanes sp. ATCC 53533]|uniref:GNAT family N-acetyltransferase n=1 Tax=Actinoplanes sp. ATCC 53533 TaxID=1288362 RepID=UPI001F28CE2A|nr:hypothetical protein [Actinoplanes sp. ATCC 53533]